ncbi:MAG: FAD-dependent oxidoreductase [Bacteroidota bacterium]
MATWKDEKGYDVGYGFHAIFKNYKRFIDLLKRAGVNKSKTFVSNKNKGYFYEEDTGKIHQIGSFVDFTASRYRFKNGYSPGENIKFAAFYAKNIKTMMHEEDIEKYDDICYTAWAIENGLDEDLTKKRFFRFVKDALFNWPHEISAYIAFKSLRLLGGSTKYYFVNGSYGEKLVKPVVDYYKKLGGKIELHKKLTGIIHKNGHITGLRMGKPIPKPHGVNKWEKEIPVLPDSLEIIDGFDAVIVTIPVDNFMELNKDDTGFWKGFNGIENLQTIVTMSWQTWIKERVLPKLDACINGLDEPMGMIADYKDKIDEYKKDNSYGSVLRWVGQETGYENYSDQELKEIILSSFLKIPQTKDPKLAGMIYDVFVRNASNHERYLLTDPGTLKFRPFSVTGFDNLFLAGDWIRNEVDVPTMEGAVCSGYTAVEELLKKL